MKERIMTGVTVLTVLTVLTESTRSIRSILCFLCSAGCWAAQPGQPAQVSATNYPSLHEAVARYPGQCIFVPSGRYVLSNAVVIRAVGNLIADYGYGNEYWNWGGDPDVGSSFAIRIDRGQRPSNPGVRDVLLPGNIVADASQDAVIVDGLLTHPKPRHRHAFYIELPNRGEADRHYPKNIHVLDNLFAPGASGVANVPLPLRNRTT